MKKSLKDWGGRVQTLRKEVIERIFCHKKFLMIIRIYFRFNLEEEKNLRKEILEAIQKVDTSRWRKISVEFGRDFIEVLVPPDCIELTMKDAKILSDPRKAIEESLNKPIHSPTLNEIILKKGKPQKEISVAIAVSDITRPVPYRGENGILLPLLKRLESSGIRKEKIKIIVATGMHRSSTKEEKIEMYGKEVFEQYQILDHDCEDNSILESIGETKRGTHVYVNRYFNSADLKIATGLVESHFMTGVSGGRKSICPGLVDIKTIQRFHGVEYLENPKADNLILEGNPCHEEAIEVAKTVGVDFILNVTLNKNMEMTGVFAGDLEKAHLAAFNYMKDYTSVIIDKEYDIVITHGGYVGRDHYQTAKAACSALPAIKSSGSMILLADNRDKEPIGSPQYRTLIHLLKLQGIEQYLNIISHPNWKFTKDQWEPEVWGRVLKKIGEDGLIYCSPKISKEDFSLLPGICGLDFLLEKRENEGETAREMLQNAIIYAYYKNQKRGKNPQMVFIREGPYMIPIKKF